MWGVNLAVFAEKTTESRQKTLGFEKTDILLRTKGLLILLHRTFTTHFLNNFHRKFLGKLSTFCRFASLGEATVRGKQSVKTATNKIPCQTNALEKLLKQRTFFQKSPYNMRLKTSGSAEIRTQIAGFKVQSANHFTIEPTGS